MTPLRLLLPSDGSPAALAAARHAVWLASLGLAVEVHLLNVQPPLPATSAALTGRTEIEAYHREEGLAALAEARLLVEQAGLPLHLHIAVGDPATVALGFAERLGCALIVMGTHGRGAIAGAVMGSVATALVAAGHLPVTLVHS
jgi:nucleotide-binding universal stress UspA family protein